MSVLLKNLNEEQQKAVRHTDGPLLIVAGAGTGKTTVITRRIAYLIEQNMAKPEEILALTFTEKASNEMEERVDLLLPLGYYDKWISTFHSFCERILKNHALDIGISNDFELLDGVRQWILIYKNFEKFDLDYYRPKGNPNRFIDALLTHFSRCKDELISPEDYLKYAEGMRLNLDNAENVKSKIQSPESKPRGQNIDQLENKRLKEVANAYHTYQKLLLDNNFLDFGDLINYTLELFKKRPKILDYYQKKFRYIMVDEFQDTNFAQFELVKMLAGSSSDVIPSATRNPLNLKLPDDKGSLHLRSDALALSRDDKSKTQNLVVVGDDDQSIYKFRGASVSNILKFKEDFPESKEITLTENYRSTQDILDLAYKFIQGNNPDRLEVKLGIDKRLKAITSPISPSYKEAEGREGLAKIEILEGEDLSEELNLVAKKILEIKNQANTTSWNDFAILIRANSAADELLPILQQNGIPYSFLANKGLYKKPIIIDILSYIRLLDNAHDSAALYRIFTLPKFHLSHSELSLLLAHSHQKTLSLFESLAPATALADVTPESKNKIRQLQEHLQKHSVMSKTHTAAEMLVQIVMDLGLEQKLKADTLENSENRELLDQLYKKIEEFEKRSEHKSLHAFLQILNLEMQAGSEGEIKFDPNLGPESLKILTVHSAKGLEFKYVFIINMVEQRFPTRQRGEVIEIPDELVKDILPEGDFHLQEERRLFYVAITRAKEGLYFSWGKDYGGKTQKKPSQFLLETNLVPSEKVNKATGAVVFGKPNHHKEIVYKKLPTRFSYSGINDFDSCPLLYKYKHYLKLPTPGSFHMSFGSTIHKTFEEFLKLYKNNLSLNQIDLFGKKTSDDPIPEEKILTGFYEKNWIDDWYLSSKQKSEYKKEGLSMLKTFYQHVKEQKPKPKFIEQFFKLKIGDYEFVGKIDRADELNGGLAIIDYKTGKIPKTKTDIDQLHVYQWAVQEQLKNKVDSLKYWYLQSEEDGFKTERLASQAEIDDLKKRLLNKIESIVTAIKYDGFKELHSKLKDHKCEFENLE